MTAVEWLEEKLKTYCILTISVKKDLEEAKIKEREQIRSAYIDGQDDILEHCKCKTEHHLNSLHYYQKTFKK
jgi:hypothetical protein